MIKYEQGQLFKPKEFNVFWKAFKINAILCYDTALKYEVKCYGRAGMRNLIQMDHEFMCETSESITENEFKDIMM